MNDTRTTATACELVHPIDHLMRADRLPHILCAGCGIGTLVHGYVNAILESGDDPDRHVCVSGIGCSGRAAGCGQLRRRRSNTSEMPEAASAAVPATIARMWPFDLSSTAPPAAIGDRPPAGSTAHAPMRMMTANVIADIPIRMMRLRS